MSTVPASLGHHLFREWVTETYGKSELSDLPSRAALLAFIEDLPEPVAPSSYSSCFAWCEGAQNLRRPRSEMQFAIDQLSVGAVPMTAWHTPLTPSVARSDSPG